MKFITPFLFILFIATLSAQSIPEIPYDSAPNLLKMPPHIYRRPETPSWRLMSSQRLYAQRRQEEIRASLYRQPEDFASSLLGCWRASC